MDENERSLNYNGNRERNIHASTKTKVWRVLPARKNVRRRRRPIQTSDVGRTSQTHLWGTQTMNGKLCNGRTTPTILVGEAQNEEKVLERAPEGMTWRDVAQTHRRTHNIKGDGTPLSFLQKRTSQKTSEERWWSPASWTTAKTCKSFLVEGWKRRLPTPMNFLSVPYQKSSALPLKLRFFFFFFYQFWENAIEAKFASCFRVQIEGPGVEGPRHFVPLEHLQTHQINKRTQIFVCLLRSNPVFIGRSTPGPIRVLFFSFNNRRSQQLTGRNRQNLTRKFDQVQRWPRTPNISSGPGNQKLCLVMFGDVHYSRINTEMSGIGIFLTWRSLSLNWRWHHLLLILHNFMFSALFHTC